MKLVYLKSFRLVYFFSQNLIVLLKLPVAYTSNIASLPLSNFTISPSLRFF